MKLLSLICAVFMLAALSSAAVFRVASDGTQTYTDIQTAIEAASPGDSLIIQAGSYVGFSVDRKLVLIGSGTGAGIGEGVLVSGIVNIEDTADSTELRSMWIRSNPSSSGVDSSSAVLRIHTGADRIFVWRCFVDNSYSGTYGAAAYVGYETAVEFVQCTFACTGTGNSVSRYGIRHRNDASITITSCVFSNVDKSLFDSGTTSGATITAQHSVFTCQNINQYPFSTDAAGIVENCLFMNLLPSAYFQNYAQGPNISYSYCAANISAPPGPTNLVASDPAVESIDYFDARAADFHPAVGSNLIDAGNPGSPYDLDASPADIGCYGGQHPYVDGGVPDYPFAVQVEVPYSAPLNGTMRIWGRGRVGPGN